MDRLLNFLRNLVWTAVIAVALVIASLLVLFFMPGYAAFGIGLGLSAVVFGLLATRE